ncbi:hypothetical protein GPECTOR_10g1110 [Gonium pectorale]|uniref:Uncharacterized protein n=1 Tax=Gonium pectorale TaxID=33097 RepID=A0A150GQG6_GONPE|nr:hypothetical protein GPECTOR_10g1110 [Gonium pectorale]|eukprot:KXZ52087.1 hypothetical protein GPECTOR_10g1110 [Gonium pectorale]
MAAASSGSGAGGGGTFGGGSPIFVLVDKQSTVRDTEQELVLLLCHLRPHLCLASLGAAQAGSSGIFSACAAGSSGGSRSGTSGSGSGDEEGSAAAVDTLAQVTTLMGELLANSNRLLDAPEAVAAAAREFPLLLQAQQKRKLQQTPPMPQPHGSSRSGDSGTTVAVGTGGSGCASAYDTEAVHHLPLPAPCEVVLRAWADALRVPAAASGGAGAMAGGDGNGAGACAASEPAGARLRALRLGKAAVVARHLALDGPRSTQYHFLPNWMAMHILVNAGLMEQLIAALCDPATARAAPHITAVAKLLRCATAQLDEDPGLLAAPPPPLPLALAAADGVAGASGGGGGRSIDIGAAAPHLRGLFRTALEALVSYVEDPQSNATLVSRCARVLQSLMRAVCRGKAECADAGFLRMLWRDGWAHRLLAALPRLACGTCAGLDSAVSQLVEWSPELQVDPPGVAMTLALEALLGRTQEPQPQQLQHPHEQSRGDAAARSTLLLVEALACPTKQGRVRYTQSVQELIQPRVLQCLAEAATRPDWLRCLARRGRGAAGTACRLIGTAARHPKPSVAAAAAQCRLQVGAALVGMIHLPAAAAASGGQVRGAAGLCVNSGPGSSAGTGFRAGAGPTATRSSRDGADRATASADNSEDDSDGSVRACGAAVALYHLSGLSAGAALEPRFAAELARAGLVSALAVRLGAGWTDASAGQHWAPPLGLHAAAHLLMAYVDQGSLADSGVAEVEEAAAAVHASLCAVVSALVGLATTCITAAGGAPVPHRQPQGRDGQEGGGGTASDAAAVGAGLASWRNHAQLDRRAQAVKCLGMLVRSPCLGEAAAGALVGQAGAMEGLVGLVAVAPRHAECTLAVTALLEELWGSKRLAAAPMEQLLTQLLQVLRADPSDAVSSAVLRTAAVLACPLGKDTRTIIYDADLAPALLRPEAIWCVAEQCLRRPLAALQASRQLGLAMRCQYDTAIDAAAVLLRRLLDYAPSANPVPQPPPTAPAPAGIDKSTKGGEAARSAGATGGAGAVPLLEVLVELLMRWPEVLADASCVAGVAALERLVLDSAAAEAGCLVRPDATVGALGAVDKLMLTGGRDGALVADPEVVRELERLGALRMVEALCGPRPARHYGLVFKAAIELVKSCASKVQGWRASDHLIGHLVAGLGVRQAPGVVHNTLDALHSLLLPGKQARTCDTQLLRRLAGAGALPAAVAVAGADYHLSRTISMASHRMATNPDAPLREQLHGACASLLRLLHAKLSSPDAAGSERAGYVVALLDGLVRSEGSGGHQVDLRLLHGAAAAGTLEMGLERLPLDDSAVKNLRQLLDSLLSSSDQMVLERAVDGIVSFTRSYVAGKFRPSPDMLRWLLGAGCLPRMAAALAAFPDSLPMCQALCGTLAAMPDLPSDHPAKQAAALACLPPLCQAVWSSNKEVAQRALQMLRWLACGLVAGSVVFNPAVVLWLYESGQIPRLAGLAASKRGLRAGVSVDIVSLLHRLAWPATAEQDADGDDAASAAEGTSGAAAGGGGAAPGACPPAAAAAAADALRSVTRSLLELLRSGHNMALAPDAMHAVMSALTSARGFFYERRLVDARLLHLALREGGMPAALEACLGGQGGSRVAAVLLERMSFMLVALQQLLGPAAAAGAGAIGAVEVLAASPWQQPQDKEKEQARRSLEELRGAEPRVVAACVSRVGPGEDQAAAAGYLEGLRCLAAFRVEGAANVWSYNGDALAAMQRAGLLERLAALGALGATRPLSAALCRSAGAVLRTMLGSGAACAVQALQLQLHPFAPMGGTVRGGRRCPA